MCIYVYVCGGGDGGGQGVDVCVDGWSGVECVIVFRRPACTNCCIRDCIFYLAACSE